MYKINKISYMACYTMDEAGVLIDRSARTIRAFVADGMPTIDNGKPTLIRGYDLINYLRTKNRVTKNPLKTNEMYCLRCREPIIPRNKNVTIHETGTSLKLSGICPLCGKVANRAYKISAKDLLSVTFNIVDDLSISDSAVATSYCRIPESSLPQHTTYKKEGQLCFQL